MENSTKNRYSDFYTTRKSGLFPNEALVRMFMGKYPTLNLAAEFDYPNTAICDMSCGDGRNLRLFHYLGMKLHATEVTDAIAQHVQNQLANDGYQADVRTGDNHRMPFSDNCFDIVVSWNACYYQGRTPEFQKTISEISRVIRPEGAFVFSIPRPDNFIFNNCRELDEQYVEVVNDPFDGIRNGEIMRRFLSPEDLRSTLSTSFHRIQICESVIDYFGMMNSHYFGIGYKSGAVHG